MPSRSACTTKAGRRFAVRRLESGNRTKTTSPRRQFIVDSHRWAIRVFRESTQAPPKIGSLRRIDADLERSEAQLTLALAEASSSGGRAPDLTIGLDLAGRLLDAGVYGDAADAVASLSLAPAAPRATVSA